MSDEQQALERIERSRRRNELYRLIMMLLQGILLGIAIGQRL